MFEGKRQRVCCGSKGQIALRKINLALKRSIDIVVALFGIVLFTIVPVFFVVPIAIKINSKGPAIFTQNRVGKNARLFKMYKFRTMIVEQYDSDGNEIMSEDRITKVGRFLRKTSLDELPQFFNILNGTMSLVGPRPMLDYQAGRCVGDEIRRFEFRPGITGLAQVKGRNNIGWEERIRYDIEYVKKFNIILDMSIILRTIVLIFKKAGTDVKPEYRGVDRFSKHYVPSENDDFQDELC